MLTFWKMMDKKNLIKIFLLILFEATMFMLLPTLASDILNYSALNGDVRLVWIVGIAMLLLNTLSIVLAFISVKMSAKESQGLGHKIRKNMFENIMNFSQEDIAKFGTSTLITRTTNDVMQVQLVTQMVIRLIIISPVIMLVSIYFAYQKESQLAWVFAITLPLIVLVVSIILYFASPIFRSIQGKTDRLNKVFREGLTGIRVIRAFNTTEYEEARFDDANTDFRNTSIRANSILAFMLPGLLLVMAVSNSLIFLNGAQIISIGEMDVGNLIAFVQYGFMILNSVIQVAFLLFFLPRAQVAAERILEVMETEPSIEDLTKEVDVLENREVTLNFEHVDFGFPGAERPAIEDINFTASKGETLAIIGGTGSGKTTIANLIPRLYEASKGKVRVNGVNVKNIRQEELRSKVGFAPQKALLFSGTIRSNMQYGKEDATDEEIWEALEIAQADFVNTLDKKLDTRVDQGGVNFSGGQRQRLSIARAIINKPDIYVFDDTFSALDFKTDANLRRALKPVTKDSITVIIAQRVNTVIDADRILVLENGKIVGEGTHQELVANNPVYQDIVSSQMKGDDQ